MRTAPQDSLHGSGAGDLHLELGRDLAGLGEAAGFLLGEDDLVAGCDLENSSGALDELGSDPELLLNLVRQTGGAGVVISDGAVLDRDTGWHRALLSGPHYRGDRHPRDRRNEHPPYLWSPLFKRGMKRREAVLKEITVRLDPLRGTRAAKKVVAGLDFGRDNEYNRACSISLHGMKWHRAPNCHGQD
jgi:hypothetical protein